MIVNSFTYLDAILGTVIMIFINSRKKIGLYIQIIYIHILCISYKFIQLIQKQS